MLLIGTDEAGYGPNLGPLVIAATAWRVSPRTGGQEDAVEPRTSQPEFDLYARFQSVVSPTVNSRRDHPPRLPIADSKQVHASREGLGGLERAVLAFAQSTPIHSWRELWPRFAPGCPPPWECGPFYRDYDADTPRHIDSGDVADWSGRLAEAMNAANAPCVALRAVTLFPGEFNRRLDDGAGKADVLSAATLGLVRELLDEFQADEPAVVLCDKHGGRGRYLDLLNRIWPEPWIETREESPTVSRYRWGPPPTRVEIEFRARGEAAFPCALASMTAKYLRERAMEAFNDYWQRLVPGLHPTAGYPQDAKRFRAAVATQLAALHIAEADFWRRK